MSFVMSVVLYIEGLDNHTMLYDSRKSLKCFFFFSTLLNCFSCYFAIHKMMWNQLQFLKWIPASATLSFRDSTYSSLFVISPFFSHPAVGPVLLSHASPFPVLFTDRLLQWLLRLLRSRGGENRKKGSNRSYYFLSSGNIPDISLSST